MRRIAKKSLRLIRLAPTTSTIAPRVAFGIRLMKDAKSSSVKAMVTEMMIVDSCVLAPQRRFLSSVF